MSPVYKADHAERDTVQTPPQTLPPVYKPGLCALGGPFDRDFVQCPQEAARGLRTGGAAPEGVCTVSAAPSVQTPAETMSPVYKADDAERGTVQTPVQTMSPVYKADHAEKPSVQNLLPNATCTVHTRQRTSRVNRPVACTFTKRLS